jgi:flagellar hook assembly protein FlgD
MPSYATVTAASLSNPTIPFNFTLSAISNVEVDIFFLKNVSDLPSASNQVAAIQQNGLSAASHSINWNALWLLGGDLGRQDGNFEIIVTGDDGTTKSSFVVPQLLNITSVDIHNVNVTPSFDVNQNPALPYVITYALAKDSLVTVQVTNSLGTVVRRLVSNAPQFNENIKTNTLLWDGLDDSGRPTPLGIYTVSLGAKDPSSVDLATVRTRTATIQSLASLNADPKTVFENNAFVYPNPVRSGNSATACGSPACFQFLAVRNNATITLKIYTIDGTLVRDEKFANLTTGNVVNFNWDVTNKAGKALGRGLYYYVAREEDEGGTLQTVKKMAVIR